MKKLMIAAAVAAVAIGAQAYTYQWSTAYEVCDGTGDETAFTAATTAYLIDSATLSQAAIYAAVTGGQTLDAAVAGKYLNTSDMAGGMLDPTNPLTAQNFPASYNADDTVKAYMVLFDSTIGENGALYFSEEITRMVPLSKDAFFDFESASSLDAPLADMTNFNAADGAWVNVAAVPEPTSGLLLLLGVAGLALRRRRA